MRRSWAALAVAVGVGVSISGCSIGNGAGVASDAPLDVYLSVPLSGPRAAEGRRIEAQAKAALAAAGGKAAEHPISLTVLDASGGDGTLDPVSIGVNARTATEDADTIAYLGEVTAPASSTSAPITDRAQISQIVLGPAPSGLDLDNVITLPPGARQPGKAAIEMLLPAIARADSDDTTRKAVRNALREEEGS